GPQFRTKPRSIQVDLGSSVTLICNVDGNPFPDVSWYDEKHKRIIHDSPNLTLKVDQETAGRYFCKAHVPGFSEIGTDATIYLKGPPSIVSHRTQFGIEGDNVRVECTIFSIPAPERIIWTFNGREVDLHDQAYSILEDPSPEGIKSTLIIRESREKHFGNYNCSVTNPYGSDVVEINLMQQKSIPSFIIIIGVAILIIVIIITILVIILCQRQTNKKPPPETDANTIEKQCKESDRSSNISDLKLDLRTGSSNSNVHCDMDYIPGAESETGSESVITRIGVPLAGPVNVSGQEIYRYSADYSEPSFPPKDGQNNNGYVPYVDYARDYNPSMMQPPISSSLDPGRERLQSTRLQLNSLQSHQIPVSGQNLPLNDLSAPQSIPNGGFPEMGLIDPRFSATYGNPYLRNPSVGPPTPNTVNPAATPAPPPYSRDNSWIASSSAMVTASANIANTVVANGSVPQVTRLPNSPTSQYIVPNSNLATIKRGAMATHV
ncbi:irregular chiasm C-roughest protein, partial [Asbolus verrucosus]